MGKKRLKVIQCRNWKNIGYLCKCFGMDGDTVAFTHVEAGPFSLTFYKVIYPINPSTPKSPLAQVCLNWGSMLPAFVYYWHICIVLWCPTELRISTELSHYFIFLSVKSIHYVRYIGLQKKGEAKKGSKTVYPPHQKTLEFATKKQMHSLIEVS